MISASFSNEQRFCDHYKRNNKAKGRKNLRCFPDCRTSGHVKTGYCGRPVTAEVSYDAVAAKDLDLMAFCEFRPNDPEPSGTHLGNTYAFADIITRSRGTGHNPGDKALHPWFPGSVMQSNIDGDKGQVRTLFSFNKGNQGWHYAWQSHRMTRATQHELHIFILAGSKNSSFFTCVCELSSPPFDIHCRRKRTSPTKAANCLMNFGANMGQVPAGLGPLGHVPAGNTQLPVSLGQFGQAPVAHVSAQKRSADQMSTTIDNDARSVSPKRPMLESVSQYRNIMPSNTVTTSPVSNFRSLVGAGPAALLTAPMASQMTGQMMVPLSALSTIGTADGQFASASGVPASNPTMSLLLRIEMLEARKRQLQTLLNQPSGQPVAAYAPALSALAALSPPDLPTGKSLPGAKSEAKTKDALALLALCC
jgi:hypothetical protein